MEEIVSSGAPASCFSGLWWAGCLILGIDADAQSARETWRLRPSVPISHGSVLEPVHCVAVLYVGLAAACPLSERAPGVSAVEICVESASLGYTI